MNPLRRGCGRQCNASERNPGGRVCGWPGRGTVRGSEVAQGRRALCGRHRPAAHGLRLRAALSSCPCQDQRRSTRRGPAPRPACVLVLTGADWKRSGWGDLPVPGGQKRRDGSPMYRSPYPALAQDRVRWVGDYVAFVVAETYAQAADAAELIEVDYEPLPCVTSTADAIVARGAARVGGLRGQHLLRSPRRRQGGGGRGVRARGPHRPPSPRDQPRHRRDDGAARLHRRLRRDQRPLHALRPAAGRAHLPLGSRTGRCSRFRRAGCTSSPAISAAASA